MAEGAKPVKRPRPAGRSAPRRVGATAPRAPRAPRPKGAPAPALPDAAAAPVRSRAIRLQRPARRVIAFSGANTLLGRSLIGLYEEDERVGKILAIDIQVPPTAAAKTRFYKIDLTQPAV